MRKIIIFLLALVAVLVLGACSGGAPDIDVALQSKDLGTIRQGDVATAEIPVRNTGQGELRIETVSTSCGCTSAEVQPLRIPPGGEGVLTIRYDSGVHPDSGPIQRYIYVATNDPDEPEVQVLIQATVQPPTS
jgi:hypothetical protein